MMVIVAATPPISGPGSPPYEFSIVIVISYCLIQKQSVRGDENVDDDFFLFVIVF